MCFLVAKECEDDERKRVEAEKKKLAASKAAMEQASLKKSLLSVAEKVALTETVGVEVITPEELQSLFAAKEHPIVYDGFEPSGRMHHCTRSPSSN